MKIEIEQVEIEAAIIEYVASQGLPIDAAQATVDLRAGRGETGMSATISITKPSDTPPSNNVTPLTELATEEEVELDLDDPADPNSIFATD